MTLDTGILQMADWPNLFSAAEDQVRCWEEVGSVGRLKNSCIQHRNHCFLLWTGSNTCKPVKRCCSLHVVQRKIILERRKEGGSTEGKIVGKDRWIEILWKVFDYSERLELVHNGCQMSLKMIKHLKWQLDPYCKGFVIMKQQLPYCNYESIVNIKCKHQQVFCISGLKGRKKWQTFHQKRLG